MSSNINVSNGTCYTAAGQKLGASFIPCGNTAFGYQTCCGAGDTCLADLACFGIHGSGYGSYLTYFAGCTDSSYKDSSCPNKQVDQPWVALTLCDNSDGAWAICSQQGNPATLQPGSFCSCTNSASATVAFKDSNSLANFASLPQSTGQTISFFVGHSPSGSPTPVGSGTTKAPSGSGGSGGSSAQATATGSSTVASVSTLPGGSITTVFITSPSGSSGGQSGSNGGQGGSSKKLGTGPIIGIAIGAVIALLLLAILAFLLLRRRRQTPPPEIEDSGTKLSKKRESEKSNAPPVLARPTTPSMPEADGVPVAEMGGQPASPWKLRSELDGRERSELDGKQVVRRKEVTPGNVGGEALPTVAELPGSQPEPHRNASSEPLEEAMVAPLMMRPKTETVAQAPQTDGGSSARR